MRRVIFWSLITISMYCMQYAGEDVKAQANKTSLFKYVDDEIPRVCFFPSKQARWDGYKVTVRNWHELTDMQRIMFVKEAIDEIEANTGGEVAFDHYWAMKDGLDRLTQSIREDGSDEDHTIIGGIIFVLDTMGTIKLPQRQRQRERIYSVKERV